MMLYYAHGWIHLSIGRPGRWLYWGVFEFLCTGSLFLLTLRWGPSGIAFAWTASYFLLMFPGFWYAGKPIGLGLGSIVAVIWKFFLASILAGGATYIIIRAVLPFSIGGGASIALSRMVAGSFAFCILYLACVSALHKGFEPLKETFGLLRDLLPNRRGTDTLSGSVEA